MHCGCIMYSFNLLKSRKFINHYYYKAYFTKICSHGCSVSIRHNCNLPLQGTHFIVVFIWESPYVWFKIQQIQQNSNHTEIGRQPSFFPPHSSFLSNVWAQGQRKAHSQSTSEVVWKSHFKVPSSSYKRIFNLWSSLKSSRNWQLMANYNLIF